ELYSFEYKFKPKFSDGDINVRFNFGEAKESTNRVYALIGENGTGKTQLLTSLPIKIAESKDEFFIPKTPLFSKIIAVSYSVFDTFETPKKTIVFNYVYCGLRNEKGELLSEDDLLIRFHHTCARIQKMERTAKWRKVLLNFLDQELVDELIVLSEEHERYNVPFE